MELSPLNAAFGLSIEGLDCSGPFDDRAAGELRAALREHGLLIFRNQQLNKAEQVEFSRLFGSLEIHPLAQQVDPDEPALLVLDSHGRDGNIEPEDPEGIVGQIDWHTDLAYVPKPNFAGVLHGRILPPEGGRTGFVDRAATYDALPQSLKERIDGLTVVQSWRHSQELISKNPAFRSDEGAKVLQMDLFPDLGFPLVVRHPMTGRHILNVTKMWSSAIVELPGAAGEDLIAELLAHSLQDRFVYWHSYAPGDLLLWDNYRMMHAAGGAKGKYRRQLYRTTIAGEHTIGGLPLDGTSYAGAEQRVAALREAFTGERGA